MEKNSFLTFFGDAKVLGVWVTKQTPGALASGPLPEQGSKPTAKYMPTATVGLVRAMPTASSWPSAYNGRRAIHVYADSSHRHITAVGLSQTTPTATVGICRPSA